MRQFNFVRKGSSALRRFFAALARYPRSVGRETASGVAFDRYFTLQLPSAPPKDGARPDFIPGLINLLNKKQPRRSRLLRACKNIFCDSSPQKRQSDTSYCLRPAERGDSFRERFGACAFLPHGSFSVRRGILIAKRTSTCGYCITLYQSCQGLL